VIVFERAVLQS